MATIINVSSATDAITNSKRRIEEQRITLEDINTVVSSMEGVWDAEDQRVYAERFRERKKALDEFNNSITASLDKMQTYIQDCVNADDSIASSLMGISWQ